MMIEAPTGQVPPRHLTLPPADAQELGARADDTWRYASRASAWHDDRASRWDVADTWGRLLVAVAASLSALSLVASNATATAVLAITTAVVSALNSALDPADKFARHRRAAKEYRPIARDLAALRAEVAARPPTGPELTALNGAYQELVASLDAVDDTAPAIGRRRTADLTPRTRWGLERLRRRLALRQEAMALQAQYAAGVPLATDGASRPPTAPSSADGPPSPGAPPSGQTPPTHLSDLGF